jgi:hypothetical protein
MSGHRKKPATIIEVNRFLADTTAMHRTILAYTGRVRVGQPHYNALQDLHEARLKTIKTVTGKDAPWASIKPAFHEPIASQRCRRRFFRLTAPDTRPNAYGKARADRRSIPTPP